MGYEAATEQQIFICAFFELCGARRPLQQPLRCVHIALRTHVLYSRVRPSSQIMFDMFGGGSPDQCQEGNWEGHKYGALFRAVAEGDEYTLRSLFREPRYKNRGDIVDGDKCGLLVTLACKPRVVRDKEHAKEIIRIILDNGGDIDQRNSVQETALGFAAHYNHMKIIAALVECGAKVNVTDWKGTTPVAA